jgi:hypothetical protein
MIVSSGGYDSSDSDNRWLRKDGYVCISGAVLWVRPRELEEASTEDMVAGVGVITIPS